MKWAGRPHARERGADLCGERHEGPEGLAVGRGAGDVEGEGQARVERQQDLGPVHAPAGKESVGGRYCAQ